MFQGHKMAVNMAKLPPFLSVHNDGKYEEHNLKTQTHTFG